jgi:L-aminopeptidase/D-esterase-like protein
MLDLLTDIAGVRVGAAGDAELGSGVSVVIFETPAVASVAVLGGAPGEREIALLAPEMTVERIDAIVLSGGSAFGLDAAGGVQEALLAQGRGFPVGARRVPIVPAAILFDLAHLPEGVIPPYRAWGREAAETAAPGHFPLGTVGAGTGATTALVKGGLGSASARTADGIGIAALMAVNALGSPLIGTGPHFWAAPFEVGDEFGGLGWPVPFPRPLPPAPLKGATPATTLGVVVTDAALTKAEAKRLALMAHDGLARALVPAHAPLDGDTIFAAATGAIALPASLPERNLALTRLGEAAAQVVARAIARGVFAATPLPRPGLPPTYRERFGALLSAPR